MLRTQVQDWLARAVAAICRQEGAQAPPADGIRVENSRESAHGDFASNAALALADSLGLPPRRLAERLQAQLPPSDWLERVEIAGPGFLNFFLSARAYHAVVAEVLARGGSYGRARPEQERAVLVEFVSANPTGPLHVGHGRGAAYGDILANLLEAAGHRVSREYYVNDIGRQAEILGLSVWLRYLERSHRRPLPFPEGAYRGDYLGPIADKLADWRGAANGRLLPPADWQWPRENGQGQEDREALLDAWLHAARKALGRHFDAVARFGIREILNGIREDLQSFGVVINRWVRESGMARRGKVRECLRILERNGHTYREKKAVWFRSGKLGDEKDRVIVRANGKTTYFASDIAYHRDKYRRGFERMINIWGADHHGYVKRLTAAVAACGEDARLLEILLMQFVTLYRGKQKVPMSTRDGQYVTLRQLQEEVGRDAARFFYVMRKGEQHLDFDLALAKAQSNDNPVYYIQYAHARICSVMRKAAGEGGAAPARTREELQALTEPVERQLMARLEEWPALVQAAAQAREPHRIAFYLRDLANRFHVYYNHHPILASPPPTRDARLALACAVRTVLVNGLSLLGIEAPERM